MDKDNDKNDIKEEELEKFLKKPNVYKKRCSYIAIFALVSIMIRFFMTLFMLIFIKDKLNAIWINLFTLLAEFLIISVTLIIIGLVLLYKHNIKFAVFINKIKKKIF